MVFSTYALFYFDLTYHEHLGISFKCLFNPLYKEIR